MTEHPDLEVLSAWIDGEAPGWAAHLAACPACRASADELRAVSAALAEPVVPPGAGIRDVAVAAALDQAYPAGEPADADQAAEADRTGLPGRGDQRGVAEAGQGGPAGRAVQAVGAGGAVEDVEPIEAGGGAEPAARVERRGAVGAGTRPRARRRRPGGPGRGRRSVPAGWLAAAVAAAVLAAVGLSSLLSVYGGSPNQATTAAGPARESTAPGGGVAGPTADSSAAAPAAAADLGDIADPATLVARARPGLPAGTTPPAAALPAPTPAGAPLSGSAGPGPLVGGTRPCEAQARSRQPSLGAVVYFATASRAGVAAVVLGFSTGPDPGPVTLLLLARDGCGELLRAAGP